MLQVYDENILFEKVSLGSSLKTDKLGFILVLNGSITFEVNSYTNTYTNGSVVIISSNNLYKVLNLTSDIKIKLIVGEREEIKQKININFNKYDAYRASNTEKGSYLQFDNLEFETLLNQVNQIEFYMNNESKVMFNTEIIWLTFNSIMYGIFGKLLSNFDNSQVNNRKEEIVIEFIQLLSKHFKSQKELDFYADKLNISIKYLSNCVREITKTPPKTFIAEKLLNEAKIALLDKDSTIKKIANDLGFSDQYAFGKFFKKHTGFSPKNYKIQNPLITTI